MTVRTNRLLPKELVDEVDHFAGPRGRSREVVEATAGAWKGHPLFPTPESVVAWVRQLRAEETDPGPDPE